MTDHRHRPGDATVELGSGDGVAVRVHISPLWTVMTSVFEVLLGWRRGSPEEWSSYVRQRVDGLNLEAFRVFDRPDRTVPNFLLPVPPSPAPTLAEELTALRATPIDVVERDLRAEFADDVPEEYQGFATAPEAAFTEFGEAVERYWDAAFAPIWTKMRAVLEREVVLCGRTLATEGVSAAVAQLHPSFVVRGDALMFDLSRPGHVTTRIEGRRIVLIPVVAGAETNLTSLDRDDDIVLAYAARGAAAVWQAATSAGDVSHALAGLLGETRALILSEVAEPISTTLLARQLDLAPATVSHHLSALLEQELVQASRSGASVYYSLAERGKSLLDLFV